MKIYLLTVRLLGFELVLGNLAAIHAAEIDRDYHQEHKPLLEETEAVGHAVRAVYGYCGMAEIAALTGDKEYLTALDSYWNNVTGTKMAITGGIGGGLWESFDKAYFLPNRSAYNLLIDASQCFQANFRKDLLDGVTTISPQGQTGEARSRREVGGARISRDHRYSILRPRQPRRIADSDFPTARSEGRDPATRSEPRHRRQEIQFNRQGKRRSAVRPDQPGTLRRRLAWNVHLGGSQRHHRMGPI